MQLQPDEVLGKQRKSMEKKQDHQQVQALLSVWFLDQKKPTPITSSFKKWWTEIVDEDGIENSIV